MIDEKIKSFVSTMYFNLASSKLSNYFLYHILYLLLNEKFIHFSPIPH